MNIVFMKFDIFLFFFFVPTCTHFWPLEYKCENMETICEEIGDIRNGIKRTSVPNWYLFHIRLIIGSFIALFKSKFKKW